MSKKKKTEMEGDKSKEESGACLSEMVEDISPFPPN